MILLALPRLISNTLHFHVACHTEIIAHTQFWLDSKPDFYSTVFNWTVPVTSITRPFTDRPWKPYLARTYDKLMFAFQRLFLQRPSGCFAFYCSGSSLAIQAGRYSGTFTALRSAFLFLMRFAVRVWRYGSLLDNKFPVWKPYKAAFLNFSGALWLFFGFDSVTKRCSVRHFVWFITMMTENWHGNGKSRGHSI